MEVGRASHDVGVVDAQCPQLLIRDRGSSFLAQGWQRHDGLGKVGHPQQVILVRCGELPDPIQVVVRNRRGAAEYQ